MRFVVPFLVLFGSIWSASVAHGAAALERGTAITDPAALRELDQGAFGLAHILGRILSAGPANSPLTNSQLFSLPSMLQVRHAIDAEFNLYISRHASSLPDETIGVGNSYDFQLFDRAWLDSPDTRFVLAGIVNRMDRAYLAEASCGEIRLIYRLTQTNAPDAVSYTHL